MVPEMNSSKNVPKMFQLWLKATKKRLALFQSADADLVQLSLNTVKNLLL